MDGNKRGTNKKLNRINRTVYVQIPKGDEVRIQRLLDIVLKGEEIQLRSRIPMRMVSKQSKFHSGGTRLRIAKAIKQHRQTRHSLTDVTNDTIDDIDTPLPLYEGKTLRTLMMKIPRPDNLAEFAILAIDSKGAWQTGSGIRITVATKYEESCLPVAEHVSAYLLRNYGHDILQYLSPSAQEEALETVWDPETDRPISWEEQLAREASADDTIPDWVQNDTENEQLDVENPAVNRPTRGAFVVDIENQSMDTFGLGRQGLQGTPQGSNISPAVASASAATAASSNLPTTFTVPTFHQAPAVDDDLTMGESIVDARVSAIENTVTNLADSISNLLLQLQQNQVQPASSPAVPPTGADEAIPPTGVRDSAVLPEGGSANGE